MGGSKYKSGDVNQEIKQIGQDSFTYYVTLIKHVICNTYFWTCQTFEAYVQIIIYISLTRLQFCDLYTKTETDNLLAVDYRVRSGIIRTSCFRA